MLKKALTKSEFTKNVATLVTGTAVAQVLTFAFSPIVSRLYSPADFGFFALFMSVVSAISVIVCGRLELAIMLPKSDDEAVLVKQSAYTICILLSLLTFVTTLLLTLFGFKLNTLFLLSGLMTLFTGFYQINSNWSIRKKDFKVIAKSRIINSFSNLFTSLSFGYFKMLSVGLVFSNIFAQYISNSFFKAKGIKLVGFKTLKPVLFKYKNFLAFNSLQALSDMFMINSIYFLIPIFFDNSTLGLFSFAMRILQAPMSLIGSSIAQVFYQQSSEYVHEQKQTFPLIKSTIIKSGIVALPVPIILFLFGPEMFAFIFGENWRTAGVYAKFLAPWLYFDFIRATISQYPIIVNRQKKMFFISIIGNLLIALILMYVGLVLKNVEIGFLILSLIMSMFSLIIIVWIISLSKVKNAFS
jgi:O-antigen/teichoic acid export membrane protein